MQYTDKLKLKKPEGNEWVNVADLNENMDALDGAVAEHGADMSRHTSAEEKARLVADIASKVTAATSGAYSWDDLIRKPSGYYIVVPETSGMPEHNCYWHCQVISDGRDISGSYSRTFIAFRTNTNNSFYQSPWVKNIINSEDFGWFHLATTEPPQSIAVPLASGITGELFVKRNQFGQVTVYLNVASETDFSYNQTIAILPEGYRPNTTIYQGGIAALVSPLFGVKPALFAIRNNGEIVCWNGVSETKNIITHFSF